MSSFVITISLRQWDETSPSFGPPSALPGSDSFPTTPSAEVKFSGWYPAALPKHLASHSTYTSCHGALRCETYEVTTESSEKLVVIST